MKKIVVFTMLILSMLLAACSTGRATPTVEQTAVPTTQQPAEPTAAPVATASVDAEALTANTWSWMGFNDPNQQFSVENPQNYSLTFQADGAVNIKADCNNASGSYTLDGSTIQIKVGPMTRAMCPPDSRSDEFIKYVESAAIYFFEDGNLFLDLMADGRTMAFAPTAEIVGVGDDAPADITTGALAETLGNLSYNGLFPDQEIRLTDSSAYYEDGGSGSPFVRLVDHLIVRGDLNGDGVEDAVALLVDYSSGSGDFVYLAPVINVETEPTPLNALMIGDRSPVKSLTIEGDQVIVELIVPGPGDPACCPTWNVRKVFSLEDGRTRGTKQPRTE